MAPKKMIHLNFFEMACNGSHMGIGMWKDPRDNSRRKDTLEYWTWLAKLAEKGKISCIFFADTYGGAGSFEGHEAAFFRGGSIVAQMDPTIWVSAMAAVSKSVAFGITGSSSYLNPFILSRTWSTLDHATQGRIAWNIVTSYVTSAAEACGRTSVTPHDQRYVEVAEFMDLCYSLWQGSWEDDAETWSAEIGAYDPEKIHKIKFNGIYHKTFAHGATHPSPQRTPVLFQAGQSPSGKAFAGKHAEAVFCGGAVPSDTAPYVKSMRDIAASNGRDPEDIKIFPQITPILGRTLEEAQAKYKHYKSLADWRAGMAKLSSFINIDLFAFPLDEPFKFSGAKSDNAIHAIINTLARYDNDPEPMTPRKLGETMAFCGFAAMPVGTAEMVADVMEDWINNADIDGFNVTYVSNPESFEDVVELLVPVLQERGIMWKDYAVPGGTFRENLYRKPGQKLPLETHPASRFNSVDLLKTYGDGKGGVLIDRVNGGNVIAKVAEKISQTNEQLEKKLPSESVAPAVGELSINEDVSEKHSLVKAKEAEIETAC